jgi:RNA 2',3'-cyclic 3'-phosphodiesterase
MRLFVGIFAPTTVQRDLHATLATAPRGPRLRWTSAEKLHVTLAFLGEIPPHRLRGVVAAVDAAARTRSPFDVVLHGLGGFPDLERPRVLFVEVEEGSDGFVRVHRGLLDALDVDLRPAEDRPLHPHLTLARPKHPPRVHEVQELRDELRAWRWRFRAQEIALVESVLDPSGARYIARHVTGLVGPG